MAVAVVQRGERWRASRPQVKPNINLHSTGYCLLLLNHNFL